MREYKVPTLDYEAVAALDDEAKQAALDAYRAEVAAFGESLATDARADEETKRALDAAKYDAAKYKMASDKHYDGFAEHLGEIEQILAETPALASMPDEDRLRTAYYIARGKQPTAAPSAEALVAALEKNPDALRLVEAHIVEKLGAIDPPALLATAGNVSFPASVKEKPKTIDEASSMARAAFGI